MVMFFASKLKRNPESRLAPDDTKLKINYIELGFVLFVLVAVLAQVLFNSLFLLPVLDIRPCIIVGLGSLNSFLHSFVIPLEAILLIVFFATIVLQPDYRADDGSGAEFQKILEQSSIRQLSLEEPVELRKWLLNATHFGFWLSGVNRRLCLCYPS